MKRRQRTPHVHRRSFQVTEQTVESLILDVLDRLSAGTAHAADVVTSTITSRGSDDRIFRASAIDVVSMGAKIFSDDQFCQ